MKVFEEEKFYEFVGTFGFVLDRYDSARGIYKSPLFPNYELYIYLRLGYLPEHAGRELLMGISIYEEGKKQPVYGSKPSDYDDGVDLDALGDFLYSQMDCV